MKILMVLTSHDELGKARRPELLQVDESLFSGVGESLNECVGHLSGSRLSKRARLGDLRRGPSLVESS